MSGRGKKKADEVKRALDDLCAEARGHLSWTPYFSVDQVAREAGVSLVTAGSYLEILSQSAGYGRRRSAGRRVYRKEAF